MKVQIASFWRTIAILLSMWTWIKYYRTKCVITISKSKLLTFVKTKYDLCYFQTSNFNLNSTRCGHHYTQSVTIATINLYAVQKCLFFFRLSHTPNFRSRTTYTWVHISSSRLAILSWRPCLSWTTKSWSMEFQVISVWIPWPKKLLFVFTVLVKQMKISVWSCCCDCELLLLISHHNLLPVLTEL